MGAERLPELLMATFIDEVEVEFTESRIGIDKGDWRSNFLRRFLAFEEFVKEAHALILKLYLRNVNDFAG